MYRILKSRGLITTPAYRLVEAADRYVNPTTAVNQLWQTDFTYFKIQVWGWYYLATIMDVPLYIILGAVLYDARSGCRKTLQKTIQLVKLPLHQRPWILTDNGSAYVSKHLKDYIQKQGLAHAGCAPHHPMTQGKIERYYRSMKNLLLLEFYYLPQELEQRIGSVLQSSPIQ